MPLALTIRFIYTASITILILRDCHILHGVALLDRVDDILAVDHLAEDCVFAVEVGLRRVDDEELAAVGVGASVGHGDRPSLVLERVVAHLVLEGVARPTT